MRKTHTNNINSRYPQYISNKQHLMAKRRSIESSDRIQNVTKISATKVVTTKLLKLRIQKIKIEQTFPHKGFHQTPVLTTTD